MNQNKTRDKGMRYHGFFVLLQLDWGDPTHHIRRNY